MAYIKFDPITKRLIRPILKLKKPNGEVLGAIDYSDFSFNLSGKQLSEISFKIHKYKDGKLNNLWDKLTGIKIIEWDGYGCFEGSFPFSDADETIKTCVAKSLETELNNRNIYGLHINDDIDIARDDYERTIFYDENNLENSLLPKALEKAPQWEIGHVDKYYNINGTVYDATSLQRIYTVDGKSIYDFLVSDIAEQMNCVFTFDTRGDKRYINCYNIDPCVYKISTMEVIDGAYHYNGEMFYKDGTKIPNQSQYSWINGVGQDTTVYMSKSRLVNSFNVDMDEDAVKNCFKVSGGDDLINNMIGAANGTGNQYIYLFDNFQYEDMSEDLVAAIKNYQTESDNKKKDYLYEGGVYIYDSTCSYNSNMDACLNKNKKVLTNARHNGNRVYVRQPLYRYTKNGSTITVYDPDDNIVTDTNSYIVDEKNGLYLQYSDNVERLSYWEHNRFPQISLNENITADKVVNTIATWLNNPNNKIYVSLDCSETSFVNVTNTVEAMAKILCDTRYDLEILNDSEHQSTCTAVNSTTKTGTWNGWIKVTRTTDKTDTKTFGTNANIYRCSTDDELLNYAQQKIQIDVAKMDIAELDIAKLSDSDLRKLLMQYNATSLDGFYKSFDNCVTTVKNLYDNLSNNNEDTTTISNACTEELNKWNNRKSICLECLKAVREKVDRYTALDKTLSEQVAEFQQSMNIRNYFTDDLWKEFSMFVREDEYNNSNYISDNLNTAEILENAKELLNTAEKELKKACKLQKQISGDINDIFTVEELSLLYDQFAIYNYVWAKIDDAVYKLRLIEISFNEDNPEKLDVTFTDMIEDINGISNDLYDMKQTIDSISSSYSSTALQAKQGAVANNTFNQIKKEGLDSSLYIIKNSDNEIVTIDQKGINCKSESDLGFYGDCQLRVIGNGIYMTDDGWNSVNMAIGRGKYNGKWVYGVWADLLCGNLVVGNELLISNNTNSVKIDENGITLTGGHITWAKPEDINLPQDGVAGLPDELSSINDDLSQLEGKIQTFRSETDPSGDWDNDAKKAHTGDLWFDPSTGATKRWDGTKWIIITDTYLESLAKSKATIFTELPLNCGYVKGDLIILTSDAKYDDKTYTKTYTKKKVYRALKDSVKKGFKNTDWDELDYTNDNAINDFIKGDYAKDIKDLQSQVDGKAETYYGGTKPHQDHSNVIDTDEYNNWTGDLWFDVDTQKSYVYTKTNKGNNLFDYTWEFMDVPKSVYDTLDGKRKIFVREPDSKYMTGDLWVISDKDCIDGKITVNSVIFEANSTLIAVLPDGVNERNSYVESDWHDISTHDGIVALDKSTQAMDAFADIADDRKITPTEKQHIKLMYENIKAEYFSIIHDCDQYDMKGSKTYASYYTAYVSAYTNLSSMIERNILDNMKSTIAVPSNYSTYISTYYSAYDEINTALQKMIRDYAEDYAENNTTVNAIKQDAKDALKQLDNLADDKIITASEKIQLKSLFQNITAVHNELLEKTKKYDNFPTSYSSSYNNFKSKYETLKSYVDGLLKDMTSDTAIDTTVYTNNFQYYYDARNNLALDLESAAKTYAENVANNKAESKVKKFKEKVDKALGTELVDTGEDYIISPYIGGGYLYIKNKKDKRSVTIDPAELCNESARKIFSVTDKNGNIVIGADSSGNAKFNGAVTAKELTIENPDKVYGMKIVKETKYEYAKTKTSTQPTSGWSTSYPTSVTNGDYIWIKTTISYMGTAYSDDVSYSYSYIGKNGTRGDDGVSVKSIVFQYGISDSSSTAPTTWETTIPESVELNKYVWRKTVVTYSVGTPSFTVEYDAELTNQRRPALVTDITSTGVKIHPVKNDVDYLNITASNMDIIVNSKTKAHFGTDGIWLGGSSSASATSSNYAFKVDTSGNGYFSGNIIAKELNLSKDGIIYGQFDKGKFTVDNKERVGIGIISTNYTNTYIGIGRKDSNGNSILNYYFLSDENGNTSHNFHGLVNFHDLVNVYGNLSVSGSINTVDSIVFWNDGNHSTTIKSHYYSDNSTAISCDGKFAVGNTIYENQALSVNGNAYITGDLSVIGNISGNIINANNILCNGLQVIKQLSVNNEKHAIYIYWDNVNKNLRFRVDDTDICAMHAGFYGQTI